MEIIYPTTRSINKNNWSKHELGIAGANYHLSHYLRSELGFDNFQYLHLRKRLTWLTKLKWLAYKKVYKKDYYRYFDKLVIQDLAKQIERDINPNFNPDFNPKFKSNPNSNLILFTDKILPLAYLRCQEKSVIWTDTTIASLMEMYGYLNNLCEENILAIQELEERSLARASLVIYTSEWAAKNAIDNYNLDSSKIKVLPWGANIESDVNSVPQIINKKKLSPCMLLFIGVDWVRKGGKMAVEVTNQLNEIGYPTILTVVGSRPIEDNLDLQHIRFIDFIDPLTEEGKQQFSELFTQAHFLILPTLADCTPHVLVEANAFGVPCLTTNVGGISSLIKDRINGHLFTLDSSTMDYCNSILYYFGNYNHYLKLCTSSFYEYQTRLKWSINVHKTIQLMSDL